MGLGMWGERGTVDARAWEWASGAGMGVCADIHFNQIIPVYGALARECRAGHHTRVSFGESQAAAGTGGCALWCGIASAVDERRGSLRPCRHLPAGIGSARWLVAGAWRGDFEEVLGYANLDLRGEEVVELVWRHITTVAREEFMDRGRKVPSSSGAHPFPRLGADVSLAGREGTSQVGADRHWQGGKRQRAMSLLPRQCVLWGGNPDQSSRSHAGWTDMPFFRSFFFSSFPYCLLLFLFSLFPHFRCGR